MRSGQGCEGYYSVGVEVEIMVQTIDLFDMLEGDVDEAAEYVFTAIEPVDLNIVAYKNKVKILSD